MGKILNILFGLMALIVVAGSCNSVGCTDNQSSIPLAAFCSSSGANISVNTVEISGVGAPNDSVLYRSGTSLTQVYLPLRSNAEMTQYRFHYTQEDVDDPAFDDILTFRYTSKPFFASEECGAMLLYHIDELTATNHLIDRVELVDPEITNTDAVRIKIYFRTAE